MPISNYIKSKPYMLGLLLIGGAIVLYIMTIVIFGKYLPSSMQRSAGPKDLYLNINGSNIRYQVNEYKGPAIILIHGFGGSLDLWNNLKLHLKCGRIISLDLIGFGGSDRPDIYYDLETQRRYLLSFMDALKVERAVLIGSSMGASISAWTAAHSPDRVQAVVLFAPSGYPGSMRARPPANWVYRPGIINKAAYTIVDSFIFKKLFPNSLARQAISTTSNYNDSFVEALSNIKQPTLLIWARGDLRVPFSYNTAYRKHIPQVKFIERPAEIGHGVATKEPQDTASHICAMLENDISP